MKLVKLDDVLELIDGSMADLESNYENSKLQEEIKRLPIVDAEPVKHGYWVVDEDGNIKCSECGHYGVGDDYCERCGAKMDQRRERCQD